MCTCCEIEVDALADEILRYLHGHRRAADTPEGIARWWIKRQRLEDSVLRVQSALDLLVARSLVESRQGPAGNTLYSLHLGNAPGSKTASQPGDGDGSAGAD